MADVAFSIPNSRSLLLDGDGDYLFTTPIPFTYRGIFTIEFWFNTSSIGTPQGLFFSGDIASNDQRFQLEITANASLNLYIEETTITQSFASASGIISPNTWYHVAVVASYQAPTTLYLNGSPVATADMTVTLSNTFANNLRIGVARSGNLLRYLNGYISNFRVVDGSAVYTGTFTPPTQPLYPIQNTTLLTCQAPTIIDTSYNPLPITVVGTPRVDDENPFGFSTSTSVSADLFDDISTTDSVINLQIPAAKSVFDIYDIQSSINTPVDVVGTDEILFSQSLSKLKFDVNDILSGIDSPVNAVGTNELTTQILLAKSMFEIYDIQSSINAPVNAVGSNQLAIPTVLPSQRVSQYDVNSRNNFSDIEPILSSDKVVNLSRDFSKIQIVERTSPQKINSLRILIENTQTLVNYSYWI